jgi:hypothetical protein
MTGSRQVIHKMPRSLKRNANPLNALEGPPAEPCLPGVFSAGSCETGWVVTVGAGFDFGPLLTFGAPVVTAEVGAEVEGAAYNSVVFALVRNPDRVQQTSIDKPLTLLQMTGFRLSGQLILEAKLGIGSSEESGMVFADAGASVTTGGVVATINNNSEGNPLADQGESHSGVVGKGAGAEQDDPAAGDEEPEEEEEDPYADSAIVVCNIGVHAKAGVGVGMDYLLVRDKAPTPYSGPEDEDLQRYLGAVLNRTTKKEVKKRAIELLQDTQGHLPETTNRDSLIAALTQLSPNLSRPKQEQCQRHIEQLHATRRALSWRQSEGEAQRFFERVCPRYCRSLPVKTVSSTLGEQREKELGRLIGYLASDPLCWVPADVRTYTTVRRTLFLKGHVPDGTRRLLNDLDVGGTTDPNRLAYLDDLGTHWTTHVTADLAEARQWLKVAQGAGSNADAVKEAARRFFVAHAGAVQEDSSTAGIIKALDDRQKPGGGVASEEQRKELSELHDTLTRIQRLDKDMIKERAVAYLREHGQTSKLLAWPRTPSASELKARIGSPSDRIGMEILEDLQALGDEAETPSDVPRHLTYLCAKIPRLSASALVGAKAILKAQAGANQAGLQAGASAGAEITARWAYTRLQYPVGGQSGSPFVATQDMRLARWEAALTAEASTKIGNRGKGKEASKEYGGMEWKAARVLWTYSGSSGRVSPLVGSGLNRGVTVRIASLTKWLTAGAPKRASSNLVKRLVKTLKVDPATALSFLESVDVASLNELEDEEQVFIEASYALTAAALGQLQFTLSAPTAPSSWLKVTPPKIDIDDCLEPMAASFQTRRNFQLQSISIRVELADEVEHSRTWLQLSHEYVVMLTAKLRRERRASTRMLREVHYWLPDAAERERWETANVTERAAMRDAHVAPTMFATP